MSDTTVEKLTKRLTLTKEMLSKKKTEVPAEEKKSNPELRRLKKIVRRVSSKRRRIVAPAKAGSGKES
jgi:predicted  nucleic acid-binding Zn-ribbon protein